MRRLSSQAFGLVSGVALLVSTGALAADSYPLICRGGGNMVADVTASGLTRVGFVAGTAAASTTPPVPGQCSWLDRGFRPGEPTRLYFSGGVAGAKYLINGVLSAGNFYVRAYNNGAGSMVVTHIGP